MAARLLQSAKNASCPNQQGHTTVVSVIGELLLFLSSVAALSLF